MKKKIFCYNLVIRITKTDPSRSLNMQIGPQLNDTSYRLKEETLHWLILTDKVLKLSLILLAMLNSITTWFGFFV